MADISEHRRLGHEIRNYMNALNLNAACLKICDPDEALECVDAMISATDAMMELCDKLDRMPEVVA